MTTCLPEIALTEEEIDRILQSCNGEALLVGGQALAFWAQHDQLDAIERLDQIALQKNLTAVFYEYQLDLLRAVPADRVPAEEFRTRRWPQLSAAVADQRRAYAQRRERI